MDWFFDQWLYRMGHPVFRVTKNYDAAKQELTLTVRQEQKPDLTSAFPQVDFFQTPVDLAIATNGPAKTTRVWLEPKEEQSFTFKAETAPVLVSFDSGDMLIKELIFDKTTDELLYQLKNDTEALGRVWALGELKKRLSAGETSAADKSRIVAAFNVAATSDTLWGVRRDAVEILRGNAEARSALQAATKDKSSLVRASAIRSLAALNDATLAPVYLAALQDPSYGVVRAATRALAATQDPQAYDALARLVATDSWRDNLRAAGLAGLSILGDKRSLEEAVRYAARGNPTGLRVSALSLLGRVGKADPRAFPLVADAAKDATSTRNFQLAGASFEALVNLADERGLEILAQAKQSAGGNVQALAFIEQFEKRLKQALGKQ
jgi:aminopeptidase N